MRFFTFLLFLITGSVCMAQSGNVAIPSGYYAGRNNAQVFSSSGTWTVPAGVTSAKITVIGGGGAGGGTTSSLGGGYGGGAGGTTVSTQINLVPGTVMTVTVGSGGTGVSNGAGNAGSASSFNGLTANGGSGGMAGVGSPFVATGTGGAGGTSSGGIFFNLTGKVGGIPIYQSLAIYSGAGGDSFYGFGGVPAVAYALGNVSGIAGSGYGAGGSGGVSFGITGGAATGGAGASGAVIIEY